MMDCQHVMKRLWEYLDGELPSSEVPALREHLAECARCYPQYRFQLAFLAVVARAGAATAPRAAFVQRLKAALASAGA
jgi:mycothiol system anti-sigma-R factor